MQKLSVDEQWQLVFLLDRLLNHDFGDLPEFKQGHWSRETAQAMWRDLKQGPLPDTRS